MVEKFQNNGWLIVKSLSYNNNIRLSFYLLLDIAQRVYFMASCYSNWYENLKLDEQETKY